MIRSCCQFISEPNTEFIVFYHTYILTSSHATPTPAWISPLAPRSPPPQTFTWTSLQPSVPLDTHRAVSSSGTAFLPTVNSHADTHQFLHFNPLNESLFRFDDPAETHSTLHPSTSLTQTSVFLVQVRLPGLCL